MMLDRAAAADVMNSRRHAGEIRRAGTYSRSGGINSVPTIVIDDPRLISGGQPVVVSK